MSAENIVQQLQQAMDMIAEERLKQANFDSTVEGTIIAINDKDNGVYLVQIQNAKFEAYAQTGQYYEGETVYVQVPQGDYTKLKFITGRKTTDEGNITNLAFRFKYPFDDFIALYNFTENGTTLNKLTVERSWRANKPADGAEPNYTLANINSDPNIVWHWYRPLNVDLIGTTLGFQMDVKTYLGQYNPIDGDYGLRILVRGDEKQEDGRVQLDVVREFYFNTDLMYGNPYGFIDETTQQALIDVSKFVKMDEIAAYFWQDHQFTDDTGNAISYKDAVNPSIECEPNIYLSKFSVGFGYQTKDIGNEDLRLYTYDDVEYGRDSTSTTPRAQLDTRTLRFGWVHKCPDDNYMMINSPQTLQRFNDEFIEIEKKKAHIYWFKQLHSDEEVEGIPYVEPGTSVMDLEIKLNNLRERMNTLINSTSQEMFSSTLAYNEYIDNIRTKYTTQINAVQDMIDNSNDQTLQRLSTMGGVDYRYISGNDDHFTYTCLMDIHQYRERFKVVVAWENTYEVSEPFEFKNVDSNVLEELAGKRNEIVFRMLREQKYKENNTTKTRLIEENSLGNFFVYDENNQCIQNEEETFWSDIYYYILVWIWDKEHETYVPLTTTSVKDPVTVEWEFPTNNTMIKSVAQLTSSDITSFQNSLIPVTNNFDGVQASTRKFKIDDYWDMRKHNNIIRATINRNGKQYNIQKMLTFGQAGTMGSKYTLRIDLIQPQGTYTIVQGQPFKILATVYDQNGNLITDGSGSFTYTFQLLNNGPCKLSYQLGYNGLSGNTFGAVLLSGSMPPLFLVGVDLHDPDYKYEILNVKGFMCCSSGVGTTYYDVGCPDRIEYKSDGVAPVFDSSIFTVSVVAPNPNTSNQPVAGELVYPDWLIKQWAKGGSEVSAANRRFLKLDTLTIYESALNTADLTTPSGTARIPHTTYKLDPYYDNSGNQRSKQAFFWDDDMYDSYPTFIGFTYGGYTFWLAIAFAHNVYASSIVNNWDGQLTIDKEKNAILTRMLAAGVKDTKNRFNGIMMGDWSDYGDTSIDPIGLYGFQEGVQSFAFKNDGTGFIGKAGHGLIVFDGTNALISDYEKEHYINLNPVYYHVVNGAIVRDKNRGSYSQYFLYAKNKKLNTDNSGDTEDVGSGGTTSLDSNGTEEQKYMTASGAKKAEYGILNITWAKTFTLDTTNDYFVVDPNNGVYMSGGLIAHYGKIGNCLELSTAGLTYAKNNGIIFIGEERTRDGKLVGSKTLSQVPYDDFYWSSQKGDKYNFRSGNKPSSSYGRYVVWIGDAKMKTDRYGQEYGIPKYLYPNFGIEHNGIVHLNKAYVQGVIHAKELHIGMDDGEYHDAGAAGRFSRTYYMKKNPANIESQGGICHSSYGDLLIEGDTWYDISVTEQVDDLNTFSLTASGDLKTSVPAEYNSTLNGSSVNTESDYAVTVQPLTTNTVRGYTCYKWRGKSHANDACILTALDANGNLVETTLSGGPNGWQKEPLLSKDVLTELSVLASKSAGAIDTLLKSLVSTVKKGYKQIRTGMAPISFFGDGTCYISISNSNTTVSSIGSVPAGIAIYQTDNRQRPNGKYFLLNGVRMGFYTKETSGNTTIDVPLLAYYQGNMGIAGNLYFGINYNNIYNNTVPEQGIYQNYLDGPNAKIVLGNGAIVLDSNIKNKDNVNRYNPKIILGDVDNGKATITLAGWDINGNTQASASIRLGFKAPTQGYEIEDQRTYVTFSDESGDKAGHSKTDNKFGFKYTTYSINYEDDTTVDSGTGTESLKTKHVNGLNKFHILHQDRGITLYEKEGKYTVNNVDVGGNYKFVILKPTAAATHQTLLVDWDIIQGEQGNFKLLQADNIFCRNIYVRNVANSNTAEKLATEHWVLDRLYDVYDKLCNLIKKAQNTGDNAYGAAKNHSHNSSGRSGSSWAG